MRLAFFLAGIALSCAAQSPSVTHHSPLALVPGRTNEITFFGDRLIGATNLWTSFSTVATATTNSRNAAAFQVWVPKTIPPGIGACRVASSNGVTPFHLLMISETAAQFQALTNLSVSNASPISFPAVVEGACPDLAVQFYRFKTGRSQMVTAETLAARLGSPFDPVIRLLDSKGKELAYCDDAPGLDGDSQFSLRVPQAGEYVLELRDIRYQGGESYRYRLELGDKPRKKLSFLPITEGPPRVILEEWPEVVEKEPNNAQETATRIQIPCVINGSFGAARDRDVFRFEAKKGERLGFRGRTRSIGYPCDLILRLYGTNSEAIAESDPTGPGDGGLTNTFKADGTYWLRVDEINHGGGADFNYRIEVGALRPGFSLTTGVEKAEAPASGSFELKVSIIRRDYDGPIALSLQESGQPAGFVLAGAEIGSKTNSATLKVSLPSALTPGEIRHFRVLGRATIDGREVTEVLGTSLALKKAFPQMLYPPEALDGLIALGVKPAKAPASPPPKTDEPE